MKINLRKKAKRYWNGFFKVIYNKGKTLKNYFERNEEFELSFYQN